jgi:flagellar M-ring protein FliF
MNDTPSTALALTPSAGSSSLRSASGNALARLPEPLRAMLGTPAMAKAVPAIALVGLLGVAAIAWSLASSAPQRTLFSGLADEEKAAMVDALTTAGLAYAVDPASGAITVGEDEYHRARMLLAAEGLPRGAGDGNDMLSALPMGSSRAIEGERIRGAREADLARTIEAIDAVESARIHLAVAEPSAFVRSRAQTAASVMVTLADGRTLSEAQVQAIVHLVASSVPQLSPDDVAVVDQRGRLLSQSGTGSGASDRQLATRRAIEQDYREALSTLLTPIVGHGNFTAEVSADVDFAEVQSTREGFPQNPGVLRSEQGQISNEVTSETPGGVPGALANQPPAATQVANAPGGTLTAPAANTVAGGGRRSENYARDFALGREVSVTRQQSPSLERLSVAVVLRNPETGQARSPAELRELERLIKGAIGFDASRGDVVAVGARKFSATDAESAASWWEADWLASLARHLTAIAIVAMLVFGLGRPLLKRLMAPSPALLDQGSGIAAGTAAAQRSDPITVEMIESSPGYEARAALIRGFVRQDPPRAALVVRDLIRSDGKEAARNG